MAIKTDEDYAALKIAMDLVHVPSQVRLMRSAPLPDGVVMLLRIAAGDNEAINKARDLTARPRAMVREAAGFFIEQIQFSPGTDSYRVLGVNPEATNSELRRNMALLLRWLHPDVDTEGKRSIFVGRVTHAWNDLKTPERRAAYDRSNRTSLAEKSFSGRKASARKQAKKHTSNKASNVSDTRYLRHVGSGRLFDRRRRHRRGFLHQVLLFLFGRTKY
jgi:hypothetical protein